MITLTLTPTTAQKAMLEGWQKQIKTAQKAAATIQAELDQYAAAVAANQHAALPEGKTILETVKLQREARTERADMHAAFQEADKRCALALRACLLPVLAASNAVAEEFAPALHAQLKAILETPLRAAGTMNDHEIARTLGDAIPVRALGAYLRDRFMTSDIYSALNNADQMLDTLAKFSEGGVVWQFEPSR